LASPTRAETGWSSSASRLPRLEVQKTPSFALPLPLAIGEKKMTPLPNPLYGIIDEKPMVCSDQNQSSGFEAANEDFSEASWAPGVIDYAAVEAKAIVMAELYYEALIRKVDVRTEVSTYREDFLQVGLPNSKVKNIVLWYRRALLKAERQAADMSNHRLKMIGGSGDAIVSKAVLLSRRAQLLSQRNYLEKVELVKREENGSETVIKCADIFKTPEKRIAKMYVRTEGLEKFCVSQGLLGYFLTMTLPSRFHPNPSNGRSTWDGSTPADGHRSLQHRWRAWQRLFGKTMSVRVEEQHKDGCPHWHALIWIPPTRESELVAKIQTCFGAPPASKIEKIDTAKASASTYLMKYLMKATGAGEDKKSTKIAELADAHRATWGGRAIVISDVQGSATIWDEMRRVRFGSPGWLSFPDQARALHSAATTNNYYEFLTILFSMNSEKATRRCSIWYEISSRGTRLVKGFIFDDTYIETHRDQWQIRKCA
jgi:hypothetical protein